MKKHYTMRAGVLLLVLTLITSCFVGGTFAKYTTNGKGEDSARVAKFGVTVTGVGQEANTMFAKEYGKDDPTYPNDSGSATGLTVKSDVKVVAPGTKGNMAAFTITGTPEVAVKVTYEATEFDLGENWKDSESNYYCPLEITVGTTTLKGTDTTYTSVEDFETAVKNAIAAYSKTYKPGTVLDNQTADNLAVSWAWNFEGNDDAKDTYLGDQAAANNAANISLKVTATVTQID